MMTKQEHTNHLIHDLQKLFNESLEVVAYEKYITIRSTDYNAQNRDFILAIKCSLKDGEEPIQSVTLGNRIDPKEYAPLFHLLTDYQASMEEIEQSTLKEEQEPQEEGISTADKIFTNLIMKGAIAPLLDDDFAEAIQETERSILQLFEQKEKEGKPVHTMVARVLSTKESFIFTREKGATECRFKPVREKNEKHETCSITLEDLKKDENLLSFLARLITSNQYHTNPPLEFLFR